MAQNRRPRPGPTGEPGPHAPRSEPTTDDLHHHAFALPDHLAAKADPALIADDERHFAAIASSLEHAIADLTGRLDAARRAPAGTGQAALDRDLEVHRLTARLRTLRRYGLDLCLGHVVPADGAEPVYVGRLGLTDADGDAAARRLALAGGRAVLRRDPRRPDGPGQPPPLPLDPRPGQRLLGRGVHPRRVRGARRRPRRPVGLHRQPRRHPLGPDARRARHHRRRPGRHRPRRVEGCPRRRRRPGHRQDRRRAAPHRLPALLRPAPGPPPRAGCCSSVRTSPTSPTSPTCCPASARRGCRPARCATSCRRGPRPSTEADPRGGPAQGRRAAGGRRSSRRCASTRSHPREGMEVATPWGDVWVGTADWADAFDAPQPGAAAQRDPRRGLGGAARHPRRQAARETDDRDGCRVPRRRGASRTSTRTASPRGPAEKFRRRSPPTASWSRRSAGPGRCSSRPTWSVTCGRCPPTCAGARRGSSATRCSRCSATDPTAWTVVRPAAARRRPAAPRRPGGARDGAPAGRPPTPPSASGWPTSSTDLIATDDSEMQRDVDAARPGPAHRARRRGCRAERRPDLLAGPFAHVVVDEAQELTDAEWQMVLRRCPSRSLTIVGDRAQARHGFTESWQERLERAGLRPGRRWRRSTSTTARRRR